MRPAWQARHRQQGWLGLTATRSPTLDPGDGGPDLDDLARDLVAEDQRLAQSEVADPALVIVVQIRAADPARAEPQPHLMRPERRLRPLLEPQILGRMQHADAHRNLRVPAGPAKGKSSTATCFRATERQADDRAFLFYVARVTELRAAGAPCPCIIERRRTMHFDPLLLSRVQFAAVISFHILFPAFTIGLAAWIVVLEARWLATGRAVYIELSEFWTKIFAVSFGMGVVSGVVMSFQFGTNWSRLSDVAGNVLGPLLNYEVASAFFLEATFLGILLFGRRRVPPAVHFAAACMVSLGTLISAFWILAANSWMQTPAGTEFRDGTFFVTSWWDVVFNPSFPYRFAHMVTATFLTTAFVVAGVSAWHLLEGRIVPHARIGFSMAMGLITVLAPLQILLGDLHGLNTLEHQPAKVAALEGHWQPETGAPLILFALPDQAAAANRYEVAIPKLGSLILTHRLRWPGPRPQPMAARRPAVRPARILRVPAHGRARLPDARRRRRRPLAAPSRPAVRGELVP